MADISNIKSTIYNKLRGEGFTHFAAMGIIANFSYESDGFKAFEEYGFNKHGTKGAGIAMWTDAPKGAKRRTMYEDWMEDNGKDLENIEDQLDYFLYELENHPENMPRGRHMSKENMNKAGSVEEAADLFMKGFEAPQDQSNEHLQKRLKHIKGFEPSEEEKEAVEKKIKDDAGKEVVKPKDNIPEVKPPEKKIPEKKIPETKEQTFDTPGNRSSIMRNIDWSQSTINERQFDRMEKFIGKNIGGNNMDTPVAAEEELAKAAIDKQDLNELEPEDVITAPETYVPPAEPVGDTPIEQTQQYEGGVQPNGRKSNFTRTEDLQAQGNTYNPLNLF